MLCTCYAHQTFRACLHSGEWIRMLKLQIEALEEQLKSRKNQDA